MSSSHSQPPPPPANPSSSSYDVTLLPTAPNSPGPSSYLLWETTTFDDANAGVFDPQFELPASWGEVGVGEPGGYEDFNPLPPLSFPPLPFTLEQTSSPSNQFYPPTTLQPLPPAPPPDQLTTSLFSTFESSALSSFLTATVEGDPSPPPLPHPPPIHSSSLASQSFKKSSESAFAGLVKARGAWDFNPVLPKGLPSWKKVGEGVQGVPGLSGLERMRIGESSSSSRGRRNPGEVGGNSGALVGWPAFTPPTHDYGGGGGHNTPFPTGRPSASFSSSSSSSKRPPSTNRRRPSSSSSSARPQHQQPPPPSSNTSGSTPSASTPTTLPDTDALMSEPNPSFSSSSSSRGPTNEGLVVVDADEIMRGVVRVAGVDAEDEEGEDELDVDELEQQVSASSRGTTKGKGKRTARSGPTPTPPPSQRDDDFIPPSSASSRNRKRPKHDLGPPPPPTSTSTRRISSNSSSSSSSSSNTKLQTPSSPEDTPMQSVVDQPVRTQRGGGGVAAAGMVEVKQEPKEQQQQQKGSFGRGLLTAKEKRENHILSEQKRRNAIRTSYAELSLILTSSTLSPLPLTTLPPSPAASASTSTSSTVPATKKRAGAGTKASKAAPGEGRGGSKSSVLGKAVGLVRWLGEGNEWLEREVERLGALVGEEGREGGLKMES
ncbi:hypothetical protein BDY24DRAFT_378808 [Mrakia frigida]|uniref:uncharacterized protein n=1 Tax=Mrakia frigida TaxID=29902 RepID=UPI003FCBFF0F